MSTNAQIANSAIAPYVSCDASSNAITISVPVNFSGAASGNPTLESNLLSGVGPAWSGTYVTDQGPITVKADAHAGDGGLNITLQHTDDPTARAYMDSISSMTGTWYDTSTPWQAGHEVGHALGLADTYTIDASGVLSTVPGIMGGNGQAPIPAEVATVYNLYCGLTTQQAPPPSPTLTDVLPTLIGMDDNDLTSSMWFGGAR